MSRSPIRWNQNMAASSQQRAGKFAMKAWSEDMDGSNADQVKLLLEDLQAKYDQLAANLKADLIDHKLQQEESLNVGLMKLPKSIRNMTVKEFNQVHGCDVLALLLSKDGVVPSKQNKKRDFQTTVAETPAPTRRVAPPGSAMRTVRRGEGLYSANGSPLETADVGAVVATVTKKRRGNETSANFEINVGDGKFISLNDPTGVKELDSSMKATAASQLMVLQDQMASLMAQLAK